MMSSNTLYRWVLKWKYSYYACSVIISGIGASQAKTTARHILLRYRPFRGISWRAGTYVCMSNYVFDKWSHGFHLLGREDVHCSRGNEIEWSKMKHSSGEGGLIDGFIVREQMWPEKARVMMYCLTIYGSSMWIQTAAFISPHLYARECSSEWAQFGVLAGTRRLMSPDMMYVLSSRSLSIIGHPQHG